MSSDTLTALNAAGASARECSDLREQLDAARIAHRSTVASLRAALQGLLDAWPTRCVECGGPAIFHCDVAPYCAAHAPDVPSEMVKIFGVGPVLRALAALEAK